MDFTHIIGNDTVKNYFKQMMIKQAISHSLLFAGPDGIGKSLFALELAKSLIGKEDCNERLKQRIETGGHPDLRIYKPEGKLGMHSIQTMREFTQEVFLAPLESKWKIFIIHDADRMLPYSANALLKTFEEPALDSIIILLSSSPQSMLPTILSRCRKVYFQSLPLKAIASYLQERLQKEGLQIDKQQAEMIATLSQGSMNKALRLAQSEASPMREILLDVLSKGGGLSYPNVIALAKKLKDLVDHVTMAAEEDVRNQLEAISGEYLSAAQKQNMEKDIEGAVFSCFMNEVDEFFHLILSWYRDLHLIQVNGNPSYLIHRDRLDALHQALQRGEIKSLEVVQKAIADAKLAIGRSSSLTTTLESLFLKLM